MVKDTPKERGAIVIPVCREGDRIAYIGFPKNVKGIKQWAEQALQQFNLAYTEPINGKQYLLSVCMEKKTVEKKDVYVVDVDSLLEDIEIFFTRYADDPLCISENILSEIDEYDETVLYDGCAEMVGLVNFHYPNTTKAEEMEFE